ncbi:head tail joining protein [Caudoviricetes sp.]|nr:head tail joining protein [Caudoviricetes sp.]
MSCMPSTCEFRTRIELQRFTSTADSMGGRSKAWTTIETPWADVREGGGSEGAYAGGRRSSNGWTATIRFTDVTAKDRAVIDGKVFNIASVQDVKMRHQFMKLSLQEEVPA